MAAPKKVAVIAKTMGQTPEGEWKYEGDEFEIDADKVSHIWMKRADGEPWPEKPKLAVAGAVAGAVAASPDAGQAEQIAELQEALKVRDAQNRDLKAGQAALSERLETLSALVESLTAPEAKDEPDPKAKDDKAAKAK